MASSKDQARLLERLLSDPEFRARFRADPVAAAREAGLELDEEAASNGGDPMQTLDLRESKSSVAGALMAAAVEGFAVYELAQHVLPPIDDAHAAGAQWDADQFGQAGTGGRPTQDALDLLENRNVGFDANGIADLKAGRIDPRVVSLLGEVAQKHKITVSAMASDHDKLTAGGSISNHYYGRAVDIASVDGRPVAPGNLAARQVAVAVSRLEPSIRPSEIGSPWPLSGAAYFSDGAHQDHLHIAFDDPIDPNWTSPAGAEPASAPAEEPAPVEDPARADAVRAAAIVRQAAIDPDDLEGNLDDEDAGEDEQDGENEDEEDEGGGEDDDGGTDDEESDDGESDDEDDAEDEEDEEDEDDDGEDAPGEGSNGEDADDDEDDEDDEDDSSDDDSGVESSGGSADTPDATPDPDYPGDHAPPEQLADWMASGARQRGLPAELPVMAALTESGLRNLSYGDADSVGFFQMRTSIWDQGEYSGYARRPERQLKWFLDHAEAVKKQRLERGLPVNDPNQYGEWIADVERPAAQYRGRYQLRLEQARALLGKA